MIVVRITKVLEFGKSFVVYTQIPKQTFETFLSNDAEWEIDYGEATLGEKSAWLSADLISRCFRALNLRKLPVMFVGKTYYDFDEFKENTRCWFAGMSAEISSGDVSESQHPLYVLASLLSLEKDDETGVQIQLSGIDSYETVLARQYTAFLECVKEKADFREKGLEAEDFRKFFHEGLSKNISDERNADVEILLDYADQFNWKINLLNLEEFLSLVIRQGTDRKLVSRLRDLIRNARP